MAQDKKVFAGGGMDMDTAEQLVAPNDYRYALNCRILSSDEDNVGIVENIKGNEQLNNLLSSDNLNRYKIIGSYEDKTTDSLFYFVRDTEHSNHKIISNFWQGLWNIIAEGNYLNFHSAHLITGVNLVVDERDYPHGVLYWTDNYNEPRKLDVERAYYTTNFTSATPRYEVLNSDVIKSILPPPTFYPICNTGKDENKKDVNYIKRHIWQFKYRWVYKNNGKSAWSPISDITQTRTGTPDRESFNLEEENMIDVRINTGSDEVKSIEIAVRKSDLGEDFKLVKTIDKGSDIIYDDVYNTIQSTIAINQVSTYVVNDNDVNIHYIFRNNEITIPLPIQETNRLFDDLPLLAKSQELIDGNRLVYGNVLNGYDPIKTDVSFTTVYQDVDELSSRTLQPQISFDAEHLCGSWFLNDFSFNDLRERVGYRIILDYSNIDFSIIPAGADVDVEVNNVYFSAAYFRDNNPAFFGACPEKHAEFLGRVNIPNVSTPWVAGWTFNNFALWVKNTIAINFEGLDTDYDGMTLRSFDGWNYGGGCSDGDSASTVADLAALNLTDNTNTTYFPTNSQYFVSYDSTTQQIEISWQIENIEPMNTLCLEWIDVSKFISTQPSYSIFNHISPGATSYDLFENNSDISWIEAPVTETRGFKSGAEHGFGIVYYDRENRSSAVNKCPDAYIPWNLHRNYNQVSSSTPNIHKAPASIQFQINHEAPSWATHYQFVYSGARSVEKFVQFHAAEFTKQTDFQAGYNSILPDSQTEIGSAGAGTFPSIISSPNNETVVKVNVGALIQRQGRTNLDSNIWTWQKGDRLRFVDYPGFSPGTSIIDFEIIGIDEDVTNTKLWYVLDEQAVTHLGNIVSDLSDKLVEVYRPNNREDESLYYEFGHMNPIVNGNHTVFNKIDNIENLIDYWREPSTYGGVPTSITQTAQNQSLNANSPAIGYFRFGDVHHRPREVYTAAGSRVIEDSSFSDFFNSENWGKGRPNAFLPDFKQTRRDSTIFYSEPLIPDTNLNGLSTFYPDVSFQEYDKRFNSIQKLYSINDSLIIFQEDKTSRAMVSRDILFDASGEQNVALSKNILSPAVPYVGDYGICKNPESFASFGFRSYFFDIRRGAVLRLSQDGLTPISEAKMKNFFTDYCEEVNDAKKQDKFKCYGAYDNKFDEYVISIPVINWAVGNNDGLGGFNYYNIQGFTIGFNEPSTRWNSFYSYSANWLESYNTGIVSWLNGTPWIHNSNSVSYNSFYGATYDSIVDVISNISPTINKVYNTISEESTDIWEAQINTKNGQFTTVTTNDFTNAQTFVWEEGHGTKENIHYAVIKGDINNGGKIEGNRMRDTSANIRLTLPVGPSQNENTLFSVNFGITPSGSPDLLGNV